MKSNGRLPAPHQPGAATAGFRFSPRPVDLFGYDLRGPSYDPPLRRTAGQPYRYRRELGPFVVYRSR